MPFAAALSEHPVPATAVAEVAGQVLEQLGPGPDLLALFVTPHHAGALEDMAAALGEILRPGALVGCAAGAVVGTGREVERSAAVSLWAGSFGPVEPVRLTAVRAADGTVVDGWPAALPFEPSTLVLLADPFSFPVDTLYQELAERHPGLTVVGGNASAAVGPGGNRLVLGGAVHTAGAVGVLLGPGVEVEAVVSQGCRPIGRPYIVTAAEQNYVHELGGTPALTRLVQMSADGMPESDIDLIDAGLHLGTAVDEHKLDYEQGDFLVRSVLGADEDTGAIAVDDVVPVGATVQFHVRDAVTADEDLRHLLAGREAGGALVFTCNGRGQRFFGEPDHDARVLDERVGVPAAGFFAAGEFGPVGGKNFLHSLTASVALFRDARAG
ncbi:MAG TPA: FIST N-terminal domain-containing protein [Acidimicrobiales bacterium]|nr:FIST N-terminal domain-containing protein [Acidimicrobiales bacterium]